MLPPCMTYVDIEGSKSNVSMNAWLLQASYLVYQGMPEMNCRTRFYLDKKKSIILSLLVRGNFPETFLGLLNKKRIFPLIIEDMHSDDQRIFL